MKDLFINTLVGFIVMSLIIGFAEASLKYPFLLLILLVLLMPILGIASIKMFNELMDSRLEHEEQDDEEPNKRIISGEGKL